MLNLSHRRAGENDALYLPIGRTAVQLRRANADMAIGIEIAPPGHPRESK